jgi:hypothetical protein
MKEACFSTGALTPANDATGMSVVWRSWSEAGHDGASLEVALYVS